MFGSTFDAREGKSSCGLYGGVEFSLDRLPPLCATIQSSVVGSKIRGASSSSIPGFVPLDQVGGGSHPYGNAFVGLPFRGVDLALDNFDLSQTKQLIPESQSKDSNMATGSIVCSNERMDACT